MDSVVEPSSFSPIFILGPTASGKSQLALKLAQKISACVVNADSIQLYEGLEIGSAAPSHEEKKRVDHHLFQVIPKGQVWSASEYQEQAWRVISKELSSRPVIVVGGSGFYIQALEKGMGDSKSEAPEVRAQLEDELLEKGSEVLYLELQSVDRASAEKIHPNDHYRLLRALGYFRTYGSAFSEDQKVVKSRVWPQPILKVGLKGSQQELSTRISARAQEMVDKGLLQEVQALLHEGLSDWWPLQSVGYNEARQVLEGDLEKSQLVKEITQKTLNLAKRQKTWFQRNPDIQWFALDQQDQALEWILSQLP